MLVNGSREYLPEARRRYGELLPVLLSVSPDILYQRLLARGRETPDQIHRRLMRNARLAEAAEEVRVMVLDNSGPLENTIQSLYQYLLNTTTVMKGASHALDTVRYG